MSEIEKVRDRMAVFTLEIEPQLMQSIIGKWGEATFPTSTPKSILDHIEYEEIGELKQALASYAFSGSAPDEVAEEAADIVILLMHLAHKLDFDLWRAVQEKFQIVQHRAWENPGDPAARDRGYWKHTQE